MLYPPASVETVDFSDSQKRVETIPVNPRIREDFEVNIRTLVSILNANGLERETMVLVNEKIRQHIQNYHNPVLTIKEI